MEDSNEVEVKAIAGSSGTKVRNKINYLNCFECLSVYRLHIDFNFKKGYSLFLRPTVFTH